MKYLLRFARVHRRCDAVQSDIATCGPQTTPFVDAKLRQTVKFMRLNGLLKLKTGDFELELSPQAISMRPKRSESTGEEKPQEPQFSDMDVLLWSAPGLTLPEEDGNG